MNVFFPKLHRRDFVKLAGALSAGAALDIGSSAVFAASGVLPPRKFSHPDRIRYDHHSLILENKPFFMYGGCFHYYRCAKPLWRERFAKIKEAGFNTVQTYVAWNMHELEMPAGLDDYSKIDLADLEDFLTMATREFGLYVSIRPGPYICAEWDTGGFPQWLLTKKPQGYKGEWLRSDDPVFMAWSRHWYNAVCPVIAKYQITRKAPGVPGVLIFQVENEYDYASMPVPEKKTYLESLVRGALDNGIEVPLFINQAQFILGSSNPQLRQLFDGRDFYPGWDVDSVGKWIASTRRRQDNAPLFTPELQGGWFSSVMDVPPLRTRTDHYRADLIPSQIINLTLFCIQNGVTMINYYMLFGGTNFGGRPAAGIATSYDYSAPIRENGGVGTKYLAVKGLAAMLHTHGSALAQSTALAVKATTGFADVHLAARKAPDGGMYLFIRTDQHGHERKGNVHAVIPGVGNLDFSYELEPFGSKILYLAPGATSAANGHWLPEQQPERKRPIDLPAAVVIQSVKFAADPEPATWRAIQEGQSLAELGVYISGFSYYRARLDLAPFPPSVGAVALAATMAKSDTATLKLDRQIVYSNAQSLDAALFILPSNPAPGEHTALVAYENRGHPNGGIDMEGTYGIFNLAVTSSAAVGVEINNWRMKIIKQPDDPDTSPYIGATTSTRGWQHTACTDAAAATQLKPHTSAVFRAVLDFTADDLNAKKTALCFSRIDDNGWIYVNGKSLGYTNNWSKTWKFNARNLFHVGNNTIAVLVQNVDGVGGLGGVKLMSATATPNLAKRVGSLEFAPHPSGIALGWHKSEFDDSTWTQRMLTGNPKAGEKAELLSWHRMEFTLPGVPADVWLPWCLKIQATGTGFIYVNGHAYGRFWEHGGQREYYLPECWLDTKPGGKNVIALCLRAVDKPAEIISASIEPYVVYAEYRHGTSH